MQQRIVGGKVVDDVDAAENGETPAHPVVDEVAADIEPVGLHEAGIRPEARRDQHEASWKCEQRADQQRLGKYAPHPQVAPLNEEARLGPDGKETPKRPGGTRVKRPQTRVRGQFQRRRGRRYSSTHGIINSSMSTIQSAIVCCLSSLMAVSLQAMRWPRISPIPPLQKPKMTVRKSLALRDSLMGVAEHAGFR